MKKIITALANPKLNYELKQREEIEILGQDIQYQEGIFEILEISKEKNIDYIILSELLPGELKIEKLIERIKEINENIDIIIILENKKEELENLLYSKGIFKIIYNNQISIEEIINILNSKQQNSDQKLKEEIEQLKNIIIQNNNMKNEKENNKNKTFKNIKEKLINKNIKNKIKKEIISISGTSGVGKSIISVNLAKIMAYEKNKILIIDFDILNNSLHTILGIKKYPQKIDKKIKENNRIQEKALSDFIIKINKRIHLISAVEILFNQDKKLNVIEFQKEINNLKKIYDVIIIDTTSECFFDYTKSIIEISNKNIFVTEANILEIKKAKNILNIYVNEWKIEKNKFNILFNKYNSEAISLNLLKKIFFEFNVIGTLQYNSKYNKLINQNNKKNFEDKKIRDDYFKIKNNI